MAGLADLSAVELLRRYADRSLSPVEAVEAALGRIAGLNPKLNAFCLVDAESARAASRASEARWRAGAPAGLVDGVPTSIKDMFLTRGWPTLRGSKTIRAEGPWNEESPLVASLRAHGAVFLGKTTLPEFGWKGVTDSPIHGVTRNPWNPARTPGGSSGG
ncbi:MAG: amidase, partial [Candidatus Rokubacteria bacterium]|nr:amidase [Candidatus Rokubacteria bacterium]